MRYMFRLIAFLVSFFVIFCDASSECGRSKKDNCLVNKESFEKIQEGDSLNIVLDLLGKPFAFDLVDNENGNRRYSWLKYSVVDDPSKMSIQEGIAIEFKGNKVASKEYYDYSSLDK